MNTKNIRFAVPLLMVVVSNVYLFERWGNANKRTVRVLELLEESQSQTTVAFNIADEWRAHYTAALDVAEQWEAAYRTCAGPPPNVLLAAQ